MSIKIRKANITDAEELAILGKETFLTSHGHSADQQTIDTYVAKIYSIKALRSDLSNPENLYYIIYCDHQIAGYSKLLLNRPNPNIKAQYISTLDRIYLLEKFYGKSLGRQLLEANIDYSKNADQKGMWLATWIENQKAIQFYGKMGFIIVGSYDFYLSKSHSNPNHILYLSHE